MSTSAVEDFLRGADVPDQVEVPDLVALPLRERHRLITSGEVGAAEWHETAHEWSVVADARYRACAVLAEPSSDSPALRLGVKDTVDVAGFPTTLGLRRYRHHPRRSAAVLRDVRNTVVTAKVVTTELNIGVGSGCGNPYFPHIDPAGSSTGSGVAVAAGICDVSLGTDVLGSVRWPAGRCGVVGLRTTHDPGNLTGIFPLCPSMDAPGWVARTADDLAFLWSHLGLGSEVSHRALRVGVVSEVSEGAVEPEIAGALDAAARALAEAGHAVSEVRLGDLWHWRGPAWDLCARDAWLGREVWGERFGDDLLPSTLAALEAGARIDDRRYAEIRTALVRHRAAVSGLFDEGGVDAWLLPLDAVVPRAKGAKPAATSTIPTPADPDYDREIGYTPVASFAGLPAITFPVGVSPAQAPLAVQLVGRPHAENALIGLARDAGAVFGNLGFAPR
ncbi:amidase family protein [Lentzea sp. NPDC058450]|uniref:amidase family protein n=1 Tax=Lentzea sp. NPDC058450 TaxID=3346505 RepID=UPI003652026A